VTAELAESRTAGDPATGPALALHHIEAGYSELPVLRDVNLEIAPSSVVAVLGPNGAGKTTLLRVATGLLRAKRGRVLLGGQDVTRLPAHTIAQRGLVHIPEGRGIFPTLTVRDNVLLAAAPGEESASLDRAAEFFPVLGNRLRQTAGSLSGGEQQMLALVRALVRKPAILAVDEASLGLAPVLVDKIYEALQRVIESGVCLVIVEQYVKRALDLADFVYVLNRGSVVYSGLASSVDVETLVSRYLGQGTRRSTTRT
jgi:branched-chain amino acid transport system ATP-binding protein